MKYTTLMIAALVFGLAAITTPQVFAHNPDGDVRSPTCHFWEDDSYCIFDVISLFTTEPAETHEDDVQPYSIFSKVIVNKEALIICTAQHGLNYGPTTEYIIYDDKGEIVRHEIGEVYLLHTFTDTRQYTIVCHMHADNPSKDTYYGESPVEYVGTFNPSTPEPKEQRQSTSEKSTAVCEVQSEKAEKNRINSCD